MRVELRGRLNAGVAGRLGNGRRIDQEVADAIFDQYERNGEWTTGPQLPIPEIAIDDRSDDVFFACARQRAANWLISRDAEHVLPVPVYENTRTISPEDFIRTVINRAAAPAAGPPP
jgi:hypothetical protein